MARSPQTTSLPDAPAATHDIDGRRTVLKEIDARFRLSIHTAAAHYGLSDGQRNALCDAVSAEVLDLLFVTGAEFSALFVVSEEAFGQWCRKGRLAGARNLGRAGWRAPLSSVLAFGRTDVERDTEEAPPHFDASLVKGWREAA